jgi:hypothetical protein
MLLSRVGSIGAQRGCVWRFSAWGVIEGLATASGSVLVGGLYTYGYFLAQHRERCGGGTAGSHLDQFDARSHFGKQARRMGQGRVGQLWRLTKGALNVEQVVRHCGWRTSRNPHVT